jgi:endoglucanase
MILAQAYRVDPKPAYLNAARETTDYIFGKNATGYCFLTGFGSKSPMFIHHRPSAGDGIDAPVPGFVSGGPNSRKQDAHDVDYPANAAPMQCWMDVEPSFASNEVCLNWNSALVYVLGFLESEN